MDANGRSQMHVANDSARGVLLQCGRQPHGRRTHAVAQWHVLRRFGPLGRAVFVTPTEARSNEVAFRGRRKPWPTAVGAEPAPSRTAAAGIGWHQCLTSLGVVTTSLALALTLDILRKRRRQRWGSNPLPCGPSLANGSVHPSVKLSCWHAAGLFSAILNAILGEGMYDCGDCPRPRRCGLAIAAIA